MALATSYHIKKYSPIYILLCLLLSCHSQNVRTDEEKQQNGTQAAKSIADTSAIRPLLSTGFSLERKVPDSALKLYIQALQLSRQSGYAAGKAESLFGMSKSYSAMWNHPEALSSLEEALPYALQSSPVLAVKIYGNIGTEYIHQGEYGKAAGFYYKAMETINQKKLDEPTLLLVIYNNLSYLWRDMDTRDSAVTYYMGVGEKLMGKNPAPNIKASLVNNTAMRYYDRGMMDSALYFYNEARRILRLTDTADIVLQDFANQLEIEIINQTGAIFAGRAQYETAVTYYQEAINMALATKNTPQTVVSIHHLGKMYTDQKMQAQAIPVLEQGIAEAGKTGFKHQTVIEIHNMLANIYTSKKSFQKALEHQQSYMTLKDDRMNMEKIKTITRLESKQLMTEKDKALAGKEIIILKQEKKLAQKNILIAAVFIGLILTGLILFILYTRNKHRQQIQEQQAKIQEIEFEALRQEADVQVLQAVMNGEEKERTRVARELHDGILSQLSAIKINLSTLSTQKIEAGSLAIPVQHLDDTIAELRKTAHNMMPEILLQHGLAIAVKVFCDKISSGNGLHIDYQQYGQLPSLKQEFELPVYRMVQELLQNVIKHADATNVIVQLTCHGQVLSITVEDDGNGIKKQDSNARKGMGLSNIQARVKALAGQADITRGETGTTAYLEFDIINFLNEDEV